MTLTVTENKKPTAALAGFAFLEPSFFKINLAEGGDGLTLGSADFIFDTSRKPGLFHSWLMSINPRKSPDAALAGIDLSTSKIGKLCAETNMSIINPAIGETEFEAEGNEVALRVANLNGEFEIFVPQVAGMGNDTKAGDDATEGTAEEDKAGQIEVTGLLGSVNNVDAIVFTNLNFAANVSANIAKSLGIARD